VVYLALVYFRLDIFVLGKQILGARKCLGQTSVEEKDIEEGIARIERYDGFK
jgi:hypothetical protein